MTTTEGSALQPGFDPGGRFPHHQFDLAGVGDVDPDNDSVAMKGIGEGVIKK